MKRQCLLRSLLDLPAVKLQLRLLTRASLARFFYRTNTEGQQQWAEIFPTS